MSLKLFGILLLLFFMAGKSFCQTTGTEYFLTVNGNLYVPVNNPAKSVYPILWYDKDTGTKVLIGGWA